MKPILRRPEILCLLVLLTTMLSSVSGCAGRKAPTDRAPSANWFDETRERIRGEFADPQQVAALMAVVDKMEVSMNDLDKEVVDYYARLADLNRNYGATRGQFQEVIDEFNARQQVVYEEMVAYRATLKQIVGPSGWKTFTDVDQTIYENWQRGL